LKRETWERRRGRTLPSFAKGFGRASASLRNLDGEIRFKEGNVEELRVRRTFRRIYPEHIEGLKNLDEIF